MALDSVRVHLHRIKANQKVSRCRTRGESEESIAHRWERTKREEFNLALKTKKNLTAPKIYKKKLTGKPKISLIIYNMKHST